MYVLLLRDDMVLHVIEDEKLSSLVEIFEKKKLSEYTNKESKIVLLGSNEDSIGIIINKNEKDDYKFISLEIYDKLVFQKKLSRKKYMVVEYRPTKTELVVDEDMMILYLSSSIEPIKMDSNKITIKKSDIPFKEALSLSRKIMLEKSIGKKNV